MNRLALAGVHSAIWRPEWRRPPVGRTRAAAALACVLLLLVSAATALSPGRACASGGDAGEVIAALNALRAAQGVGPLSVDASLMSAAQGHSDWMALVCAAGHTEPGHNMVVDRVLAAGYGQGNRFVVRENVAGGAYTPSGVVDSWAASPGHFWAMTRPEDTDVGVGVAWGCGWSYYTLNMGYVLWGVPLPSGTPTSSSAVALSPPPGRTITHVVQPGESPWSIAQLYGISDNEVLAWNYLSPWDPIYAGQHLLIPVTPTATQSTPPARTATLPTSTGPSMEPTLTVLPPPEGRVLSPTGSPGMDSGTFGNVPQLLVVAVGLVLIVIGAIAGMRR